MHRAVAEWYETVYQDDLSPFHTLLAHHWRNAIESPLSDPPIAHKAIGYFEKSGEKDLHNGAYREAVGFFTSALQWDTALSDGAPEPIGGIRLRRAGWERRLGEAYLGLGDLAAGREHLERALALLRKPAPKTKSRMLAALMGEIMLQIRHRLNPRRFLGRAAQEREVRLAAALTNEKLAEVFFFLNDTLPALHTALRGLNLAEEAGQSPELARLSGNLCSVSGLMGLHGPADVYDRQANDTARSIGELPAIAYTCMTRGLYTIGIGRWEVARLAIDHAVEQWGRLGDRRYWEACSVLQLMLLGHHDGDFARSFRISEAVYASGRRSGNVRALSWGLLGKAENALRMGRAEEALGYLNEDEGLIAQHIGRAEEIRIFGLLALARLRLGNREAARQMAENAADLITHSSPTTHYSLEGYAAVAETFLTLWADGSESTGERKSLMNAARQSCAALAKFSKVFWIGQPRAQLWKGTYDWLSGKPALAHKTWQKSLALAVQKEMPYEEKLVRGEIERHAIDR